RSRPRWRSRSVGQNCRRNQEKGEILMANDVAPAMHSDFPRWYREVGVDENRDRLRRRWTGVSALADTMTRADVETTLRIVFRSKHTAGGDGIARIRQVFKDTDDLFDMQGNDREMEVLCGSCLAVLFERDDVLAASGALAVTTAAADGA